LSHSASNPPEPRADDLAFTSAHRQAELIRRREVSPTDLVRLYLDRIERLDPMLNAFVTVDAEHALAAARHAEKTLGDSSPPFHGVPISIKDMHDTAGLRTTSSTRALRDHVPEADSASVRRLRLAGFVFLGKTNVPELGSIGTTESELNGVCRNPWDTSRSTGGSSGGAAAALAAGLCPVSHGSDGAGSIRIPASCCGVFGLKPSRGRVSIAPWAPLNGYATEGPLARSVEDAAALLDVIAGHTAGDPFYAPPPERSFVAESRLPPGPLRIAYTTTTPNGLTVDPVCRAAAERTAELLEGLGHRVEAAAPDWSEDGLVESFLTVLQAGIGVFADAHDVSLLDPVNRDIHARAESVSSAAYMSSLARLQRLARRIAPFFETYDVLVTPTLGLPPVLTGWYFDGEGGFFDQIARDEKYWRYVPLWLGLFNLAGNPAVSLPLAWTDDGLPIGVQIVGRPFDEATLLRLSAQVEEARPWKQAIPSVAMT
jgi:amidase